jgi:hypothetical protein
VNPRLVIFPIPKEVGCQGPALGQGDENQGRLEQLIERLERVVPHLERLERLANQLGWEVSGLIWTKGE